VGCKGRSFIGVRAKWFVFYLNYVGCKDQRTGKYISQKYGFTLTMWDVKLREMRETLSQSRRFYLNYVGCKGFI